MPVDEGLDVVLRDGSTVRVRPVHADDVVAIRAFFEGLSDQARWFRFFSVAVNTEHAADAAVNAADGVSLIAVTGVDRTVIAHGCYLPVGASHAEIAFAIADAWQELGIGTILLAHLADAAASAGIDTFTASVLASNHRMIGVLRDSGYPVELRSRAGEIAVTLPTSLTPDGRQRFEEREQTAAIAAIEHVLRPRSIAVIGASRQRGTVGGEVLRNILAGSYDGTLYAVDPTTDMINGIRVCHAIRDLPEPVDLAVIAVTPIAVLDVARACGELGVKAIMVMSAGFAELGERGAGRLHELLAVCRTAGMRMLGPNCMGVFNTPFGLNATSTPFSPQPGRVAFASQSGSLGIAALETATERSIGLSSFASLGDRADLSNNDFLDYWGADDATDAALLYLESFGNPRNFGRVARRFTASKPLIAVKSGRGRAGPRAAGSHTAAIVAASDNSVDALFDHAGVIRTETIGEMLDVACMLTRQPLPRGDRIAIVTNGRGPGILCADACDASGVRVEELADATKRRLAAQLPIDASVANPVDITASATAADYQHALDTVVADPGVDAVIVIFVRPLATRASDVARAVVAASGPSAAAGKPVLAVFMGADTPSALAAATSLPVISTPEEAARAIGHAVRYARRRALPADPVPDLEGLDMDRAAAIIAEALGSGGGWLPPAEVKALLQSFGFPLAESITAISPSAAAHAAEQLDGPVAVRAVADGLAYTADADAVRLGLKGAAEVERAACEISASMRRAGHMLDGYLIQAMAPEGHELLVGVLGDPAFGPLVVVGVGGTAAELIRDVQVRLAPVGRHEADEMVRSLRTFPLLAGSCGYTSLKLGAVQDVLLRAGALAAAHPEIAELDCNPVIASQFGVVVVNARVRIAPPPPTHHYGALDA